MNFDFEFLDAPIPQFYLVWGFQFNGFLDHFESARILFEFEVAFCKVVVQYSFFRRAVLEVSKYLRDEFVHKFIVKIIMKLLIIVKIFEQLIEILLFILFHLGLRQFSL
jgi:hypothetical protein